jgi:hypothetical protein
LSCVQTLAFAAAAFSAVQQLAPIGGGGRRAAIVPASGLSEGDRSGSIRGMVLSPGARATVAFRCGRDRLEVEADPSGRFAIYDLEPGSNSLVASAPGYLSTERSEVFVRAGEVADLETLALVLAGTVEGRVIALPGAPLAGFEVELDSRSRGDVVRLGPDGRFRFDHLPEGKHELVVRPRRGVLARQVEVPVAVVAGEVATVGIDLRERAPLELRLEVALDGLRSEGLAVRHDLGLGTRRRMAGRTRVDGALSFEVDPDPRARVLVESTLGLPLGAFVARDDFRRSRSLARFVDLPVGYLAVEFPPDSEPPATRSCRIRISATGRDRGGPWSVFDTPIDGTRLAWSGSRCELGPIAPGAYTLEARASSGRWKTEFQIYGGRAATVRLTDAVFEARDATDLPAGRR